MTTASIPPSALAGPPDDDRLVVGLGASAGGMAALKHFFAAVPPNSGMCYVVMLHLSTGHEPESSLAEVLAQSAAIPMTAVRERTLVRPDHGYVVSPGLRPSLVDGHLDVVALATADDRCAPIDFFFRTLAEALGARGVCVVLSGTGADGSMGMKRVKEVGGACIAQSPADAEFDDMPRNAIATGLVDHVLPASEIPARLAALRQQALKASNEKLHSVNEALTVANRKLKIRIDELSHASNDSRNLMNSTDLATVFVDRSLRIKLFTPRARTLFNVIPTDAGRLLLDVTHRLQYPQMMDDIERVLDTLATAERVVQALDQRWYIARVLPYRTADDRIDGVVLTFTDITDRKRAEDAVRASEERVNLVVESATEYAIFTLDVAGVIRSWNSGAAAIFGYAEDEVIGQHFSFLFLPEDRAAGTPEAELRAAREQGKAMDERWHQRKNGERFFASGVTGPIRVDGAVAGYTKVARDLTQRERADDIQRVAHEQLERRVDERTSELADANESLRREMHDRGLAEQARVRLLRQLVSAQEEERQRISRELHDQLGQEVTALGLKLAALKNGGMVPPQVRVELDNLEQSVKQIEADLEFLVWELRPTGLDDLGLAEALADYVASWSQHTGIAATVNTGAVGRLSPETETVLYRIAQEALNNAAKHSQAKAVDITLEYRAHQVRLTVSDDGKGFDPATDVRSGAIGLLGMRERAALVGGTSVVESRPGHGTVVRVQVPA